MKIGEESYNRQFYILNQLPAGRGREATGADGGGDRGGRVCGQSGQCGIDKVLLEETPVT